MSNYEYEYFQPRSLYKVIARRGKVRLVDIDYDHSDDWTETCLIDPVEWIEWLMQATPDDAVKMMDDLNGL